MFPNKTSNGLIGMIHRNEVDVGVAPFFINKERAEIVDFSIILDLAEYDFNIRTQNSKIFIETISS